MTRSDSSLPAYTSDEIACTCKGPLHPEAVKGLYLFNKGNYFEAHEALELAWREETRPIRDLYRGILQVGVAYYHILRHNYVGARKMFIRCRQWLQPFPDTCRGINVARFCQDYLQIEKLLIRLGPEGIEQITPEYFKSIDYNLNQETT